MGFDEAGGPSAPQPMSDRLQAFFNGHLPPGANPHLANVVKTSTGRSRQNWSFDLTWQDEGGVVHEPLILRCDPAGGLVETDRSKEFAVLQAVGRTGVSAPAARWLDAGGRWFGSPSLIMGREPGLCDYYVLNGPLPLQARVRLAEQFCDLLARVHTADWKQAGLGDVLEDPGPAASVAELERWETVLRRDQREAYPEIDIALLELRACAPTSQQTVLVHGDFKPGNILLEDGNVVALLDWELAHLGDPLEDLGWVTQPLRRREHIISGAWEESEILERYTQATGFEAPGDHVRWWNTFATLRTAVMQVSGLRSFLEGRSEEPYRPSAAVLRSLLQAVGT